MELDSKLVQQNRHVREFAKTNRLRTVTLPDGEVVLPIGPRKRAASKTNHLGSHAWFANGSTWRIFVQTHRPHAFDRELAPFTSQILHRDGELEATVSEPNLLPALDASGNFFRAWRKRRSDPMAAERLRRSREARLVR